MQVHHFQCMKTQLITETALTYNTETQIKTNKRRFRDRMIFLRLLERQEIHQNARVSTKT